MANKYQSTKSGRQIDAAIDAVKQHSLDIENILTDVQKLKNSKAEIESIPQKTGDLTDNTTEQNYNPESENPQSGKAVAQAIAKLLGSAPENLDTLEELAKALNEDENFSATVLAEIAKKVDKVDGKGLSTNDYTTAEKEKLKNIETGATKVVVDDTLSSTSENPVQNKVLTKALGNYANTIKETASGEVVSIDDISPIEHDVGVKVSSKNLLRLDKATVIGLTFGKKLTEDGTGVIIPANKKVYGLTFSVANGGLSSYLKAGNTYTLSCESDDYDFSRVDSGWKLLGVNGSVITQNTGKVRTITPTEDIEALYIYLGSPTTLENEVIVSNFMAEESEQKTEYTPYVDVSTVNVKTLGKNLFKPAAQSTEMNGVTLTLNEDNSYTLNGTVTENTYIWIGKIPAVSSLTYYLSGGASSNVFLACQLRLDETNINTVYSKSTVGVLDLSQTTNKPYNNFGMVIVIKEGTPLSNVVVKPMISFSSDPSYEPYIEPASYTVETDGRAEGVKSIYPTMTMYTDTSGVIVNAEYNADTKKYIDNKFAELQNAILSTGGNV